MFTLRKSGRSHSKQQGLFVAIGDANCKITRPDRAGNVVCHEGIKVTRSHPYQLLEDTVQSRRKIWSNNAFVIGRNFWCDVVVRISKSFLAPLEACRFRVTSSAMVGSLYFQLTWSRH